ncbi:hypothetical protein WMZ97_12230 [Lentibacillus sp. N15]|uniref:hypothetical protein n=1 Tax=Lentibacillus songyuanensis TaxID=3136161 RepID=UPI0031BA38BF
MMLSNTRSKIPKAQRFISWHRANMLRLVVERKRLQQKPQKKATKKKTTQAKGTVYLPASAKMWKTYKTNVKPVAKNSDWSLTPSKFGGLTYKILARPYPDVVTIQTDRR